MTLALLDGDIIAYRAACGMQQTYDFGDTGKVVVPDIKGATEEALKLTREWADMVDADTVVVGFTTTDKFRTRILPTYKANRPGEKPAAHAAAVQVIKDNFPHHTIHGLEADDILGILMTTPKYADHAVIVSIDKDFRTIPGRLFNPSKPDDGIVYSGELEANCWWMYQTLIGDSTDNYKGCPGIGPVKAMKMLPVRPLAELWPIVVAAFKKAKLTEEDALTQARVARILRREDYDKKHKRIRLWHPTTPIYIPVENPCPVSVPLAMPATDTPAAVTTPALDAA